MTRIIILILFSGMLLNCSGSENRTEDVSLLDQLADTESISGTSAYIHSPFVTPGDRAYLVGHQDGTFPALGWHITGEMGGLWAHPVKLLDGFNASLHSSDEVLCLSEADDFVNYPFANAHIYSSPFQSKVTRLQFSPDDYPAIVVEFSFENLSDESQQYMFEFNAITDIRPTWLGERTQMSDYKDIITWNSDLNALVARDSLNPWNVIIGSPDKHLRYDLEPGRCVELLDENSVDGSLTWIIELPANGTKTITIVITGGADGFDEAANAYNSVLNNYNSLFQEKKARYEALANASKLTLDDKKLEEAFRWVKYNTDWLVQEVPGVGRGLTAGIPDYPWWFGADSEYALQGAMMVGQEETVYATMDLLLQLSQEENGNGRVVHEVSSNGAVFNPGNINETPQFTSLVWRIFQWSGDRVMLERYYPFLVDGMEWLLSETDLDKNLLPDGFGMMEIHGLDSEMIDVAAYTQKAFADLAEMATILGKDDATARFSENAAKLAEIIETDFWVEEFESYADFIGTAEQADHLIEDAINRADSLGKPWAVDELKKSQERIQALPPSQKQGFVMHHNWVVNTPMETGVASPDKALKALETGSQFVNPFGMFVTGIDRDESAGEDEGSFQTNRKIFTYIGAVMTLPTGVQAVAENNYMRPDMALDYIQRMTRSFSYALPGSMYEVSPDFGMMTQAWNIYSYAVPIIHQFFGIRPEAYDKKVVIRPILPSDWKNASIENVKIGDNLISVYVRETSAGQEIEITQTGDWDIELILMPEFFEGSTSAKTGAGEESDGSEGKSFQTKENSLLVEITP